MFNKSLFALLLCSFTIAIVAFDLDAILSQHRQSLKSTLGTRSKRSVDVQQGGVEDCFDWYFNAIDDNINVYRDNSTKCNDTAAAEIKLLNAQGDDTRDNFVGRKRTVCQSFEQCEENSDLLEFHDCYQNVSSKSIAIVYNLSVDSKVEHNKLSGEYNNVYARKNVCDENVREEYIKNATLIDEQFNACRTGKEVPTHFN